jgi:hypothetical protein
VLGGVFFSTTGKIIVREKYASEFKSKFLSIISFSLIGSLLVASATNSELSHVFFSMAIVSAHFGGWTLLLEVEDKNNFNEQLTENIKLLGKANEKLDTKLHKLEKTLDELDFTINKMPNKGAFKSASKAYLIARPTVISYYKDILTLISSDEPLTNSRIQNLLKTTDVCLEGVLENLREIVESSSSQNTPFKSANIMLLRKASDEALIKNYKNAFKNGRILFPDNSTLEELETFCDAVLCLEFEAIDKLTNHPIIKNKHARSYIKKKEELLLPVGIHSNYDSSMSIMGAPECCQRNHAVCVPDVAKIADNLEYSVLHKQRINDYYKERPFHSIVSLPLPKTAESEQFNINNCIGVVDIYGSNPDRIKDLDVLYHLTVPLLHLTSDILKCKSELLSYKNIENGSNET